MNASPANSLSQLWERVHTVAEAPSWVVLSTLAFAVALVVFSRPWRVARNIVTIAHEGGHALAAFVCGRRLNAIRLHSDTSGVTVSSGRPDGFGMVVTAAAGYPAPSLLGCLGVLALDRGLIAAWLCGLCVALLLLLLMTRNLYGLGLTAAATAGAVCLSWWGSPLAQAWVGWLVAWFLLVAGPRPIVELQTKRLTGDASESDADQLAALTGIPGLMWVVLFGAMSAAAIGYGLTASLL